MAERGRRETGMLGESIAALFLERKGYKIIEKNYRRPWGEIDLIAERSGVVCFVEVKAVTREIDPDAVTREMLDYRPEEQVHPSKLQTIARTAELYMADKHDVRDYQIDVVGVIMNTRTRRAHCRLYEQVL